MCSLKGSVGEVGSVSHSALPFPFLFPPKHPSVPKGSDFVKLTLRKITVVSLH